MPGAVLCPDASVTVTLQNIVYAGVYRIFGMSGAVLGVRSVRPEWFGALGDNTTDDQPAFQKAHDCVEQSLKLQRTRRAGYPAVWWHVLPDLHHR